jgi:hypothetical protein
VDIGAWIGASFWLSGINGSAAPAVSVSATGGYTFGADAGRIARFRLGGRMGATFLDDVSSELALLSMLADPAVVLRLSGDRLFVTGDVGVGLLLLTGLQPGSALLEPGASPTGRQALLEIRPGAAFDYRLTPALSLLLSSGVAFTPKADHFYAPFLRLELHFGLAVRL